MAQIWAQFSSTHYDVHGVRCHSGGTEETAFNSSAVDALKSSGLQIEKMIESENPDKPLSDEKISQILTSEGFPVARRTVAKYREQLNIPVARLRKKI